MQFDEALRYAVNSLRHRSLRSWLTVLGIVIGIGSIVILISLAQGLDSSIRTQLNSLGTNYIVVLPGQISFRLGPPTLKGVLTVSDRDAIARVPGVVAVSGNIVLASAGFVFKGINSSSAVSGVEADAYSRFITSGYEEGKFFSPGDTGSVVIGWSIAHEWFKQNDAYKEIHVGDRVTIQGQDFRVKGVIAKVGQSGGNLDSAVLIDVRAARELQGAFWDKDRVIAILAVTDPNADLKAISDDISTELRNHHKVLPGEEDFTLLSADSIAAQVGQVTGLLSLFLGGVAAISLVVGGIGVANAMFTSVLERTREIGILKALGASEGVILQLFILEAGLIGLLGGLLGILLAVSVSKLLSLLGVPSIISWELGTFALAFSFAVGVISGLVPARNASKLQPVEALRYE